MSILSDGESPVTRPQSRQLGHLPYQTVAQGADTDCYGELIDSILGAYFGPGHLEERWLALFNDDIHTMLAWPYGYERSLSKLAKRMGKLPRRVAVEFTQTQK